MARASNADRSSLASCPVRRDGSRAAIRSSPSVRLNARGNPGIPATGAKYASVFFFFRSSVTRAETASSLSGALGVKPLRASAGTASFATSSATLARVMPNVAPFAWAIEKANSSAAARVAPTIASGGSTAAMRARASARRDAAEGNTIDVKGFIGPTGRQANRPAGGQPKIPPPHARRGQLTPFKQVFYTYVSDELPDEEPDGYDDASAKDKPGQR